MEAKQCPCLGQPLLLLVLQQLYAYATDTEWPATSMNLLSSFVRIKTGESLTTEADATSQVFYVIRCVMAALCLLVLAYQHDCDCSNTRSSRQ